jgi:hypothetical protein
VVERLAGERGAAVDGERKTGRAGDELAAGHPGAGRHGHPRLDLRQAAARLRDGPAEQVGA